MKRSECLEMLRRFRPDDAVVVSTMGSAAQWSRLSDSELDFPSVGSAMGHAADFGMGLALAQPERKIWVLNGDGSMLMSLGTLVTICHSMPRNLVLFVLQNDTFEVTGNQPIPGAGKLSFLHMARGAGFPQVHEFESVQDLNEQLASVLSDAGPIFINLRIDTGNEPAPQLDCPLKVPASLLRTALLQGGPRGVSDI